MTDDDNLLLPLTPSRRRQKVGDVFAMKLVDGAFVFGRIANPEAEWTSASNAGTAVLVYIYNFRSPTRDVPERKYMTIQNLLIPPTLTNRLGWSRGFFETFDNLPSSGEDDIRSRHCFDGRPGFNAFFDDRAREVSNPFEPVGDWSLSSYNGIALDVVNSFAQNHP